MDATSKKQLIAKALENPELAEAIENLTHLLADAVCDVNGYTDPSVHDGLVPEAGSAVNDFVEKFISDTELLATVDDL